MVHSPCSTKCQVLVSPQLWPAPKRHCGTQGPAVAGECFGSLRTELKLRQLHSLYPHPYGHPKNVVLVVPLVFANPRSRFGLMSPIPTAAAGVRCGNLARWHPAPPAVSFICAPTAPTAVVTALQWRKGLCVQKLYQRQLPGILKRTGKSSDPLGSFGACCKPDGVRFHGAAIPGQLLAVRGLRVVSFTFGNQPIGNRLNRFVA